MKTITLHQPWASLIAAGLKTIETRTHDHFAWLAGHRIAIHAGKRYDMDAPTVVSQHYDLTDLDHKTLRAYAETIAVDLCPRGAIVCTAKVTEARWLEKRHSTAALCPAAGLFGLFLAEVEVVDPPVKVRGQQGVWEWRAA